MLAFRLILIKVAISRRCRNMGEFSTRRWETRESPLRSGMEDYSMDMREPADSHGQKAMRMRRLRSWSKIVLWASLLGQMGGVAGLASPERRDPTYHASRYLQPCKTVADCGARQVCLSGQCTCPFILGLTGAPECTTKSKVRTLLCYAVYWNRKGCSKVRHVNVNGCTCRVLGSSCAGR